MPIDMNSIKEKASLLMQSTTRTLKKYSPEAWVPEKKFANAVSASMALMVIADKKIENEEVEAVMDFIIQIPAIQDLQLGVSSIELFEKHLEDLEDSLVKQSKYIITTSKIIVDIGRIKEYPEYVRMLSEILDHVAGSDGNVDSTEIEMKKRIMKALR